MSQWNIPIPPTPGSQPQPTPQFPIKFGRTLVSYSYNGLQYVGVAVDEKETINKGLLVHVVHDSTSTPHLNRLAKVPRGILQPANGLAVTIPPNVTYVG